MEEKKERNLGMKEVEREKDSLTNCAHVNFDARSINEGFARMVAMGFMMDMNPTVDELADVKTAVSEAVTNAIIHGYDKEDSAEQISLTELQEEQNVVPQVEMTCLRNGQQLTIIVEDYGVGIADVEKAREPFYTTKPDMERSGMGFAFMETFMDEVEVWSKPGEGTRVTMSKYISNEAEVHGE